MEANAWNISLAVLVVFVISRVQKLFKGIRATGNIPGYRIPLQPYGIPGALFKTSWWNPGLEGVWHWRRFLYKQFNHTTISIVPFLIGPPAILTSDPVVAKQILSSNKSGFVKLSIEEQRPVSYWGTNLFVSEGNTWKKHRRIVLPAFSQKLYELVWSETLDLFKQMVSAEGFEEEKSVQFSAVQDITYKLTFCIIGRCGFDFPFNWEESTDPIDGEISFPKAMRFFFDNVKMVYIPRILLTKIPFSKFKKFNKCIDDIRNFMDNKIAEKEKVITNHYLGNDIFSVLVQANLAEKDSKHKLDYSELISNVFLMLSAGHETTGHTLAATLACLAKFPDQQEEVVNQILSVVGTDRDPTFDDYPNLYKVQAAFYEALRMFSPAYVVVRKAKEDTTLNVANPTDQDEYTPIPILKGTQMTVDFVGLNRNPRYFEDPEVYRISRWYNIPNEAEAVPGFGFGQRTCIGRKFALTEAVCFLTMLIRDWKVEPLLTGESVDEWFEKFSTEATALITFSVGNIPVRFVRRS